MFALDVLQIQKLDEWQKKLNPPIDAYAGAIGGRLTYSFSPTSIGVVIKVYDSMSKTEIDLTDYESW